LDSRVSPRVYPCLTARQQIPTDGLMVDVQWKRIHMGLSARIGSASEIIDASRTNDSPRKRRLSLYRAHGKSSLLLSVPPFLLLLSIAIGIKFCRDGHEPDGLQQ
jgi:hypothetical protein